MSLFQRESKQEWVAKHNHYRNFSARLYSTLPLPLLSARLYSSLLYSSLLYAALLYSSLYLLFYTLLCSTLYSSLLYSALLYLYSAPLYSSTSTPVPLRLLLYLCLYLYPYSTSTLLCSTLLCSILLFSTLLYSTLLYSTLLDSTLLYSALLCSTLLYSSLLYLYSTLLGSTLLYLYSTLPHCFTQVPTGHNDLWASENKTIRQLQCQPRTKLNRHSSTFCSFSWSKQTASPPQEVHWSHYSFQIQICNKSNSATFHPFLFSVPLFSHYYPLFINQWGFSGDLAHVWSRTIFIPQHHWEAKIFYQTTISRTFKIFKRFDPKQMKK